MNTHSDTPVDHHNSHRKENTLYLKKIGLHRNTSERGKDTFVPLALASFLQGKRQQYLGISNLITSESGGNGLTRIIFNREAIAQGNRRE